MYHLTSRGAALLVALLLLLAFLGGRPDRLTAAPALSPGSGAIEGTVWKDAVADGMIDPTELRLVDVTLSLEDEAGATRQVVTGMDGRYRFAGIGAGLYTVTVDALTIPTALAPIFDPDGTGDPHTALISLADGEVRSGVNFGYGDCGECDGGITSLIMRWEGTSAAHVQVYGKDDLVFDRVVNPNESFGFTGVRDDGKLGTNTEFFVDGLLHAELHTSCSQEVFAGLQVGDFVVVAGSSRDAGPLCPGGEQAQQCSVTLGAIRVKDDEFKARLYNLSMNPVTIERISFTWPAANGAVEKIEFNGTIYETLLPPPMLDLSSGWHPDEGRRQVDAFHNKELKIRTVNDVDLNLAGYTLRVEFAEGEDCVVEFNNPSPPTPPQCEVLGTELKFKGRELKWRLTNLSPNPVTLSRVMLTWPAENGGVKKITLDGTIYETLLPPPSLDLTSGWHPDLSRRQVKAEDDKELKFEFETNAVYDLSLYQIRLEFAEGADCILAFDLDPPVPPTPTPTPTPGVCVPSGLDIYYLLDVSGSMGESYSGAASKLDAAKSAILTTNGVVSDWANGSRLGLITFNGRSDGFGVPPLYTVTNARPIPLTTDDSIFGLALPAIGFSGTTPTAHALRYAVSQLPFDAPSGNEKVFILLSDGVPTLSYEGESFRGPNFNTPDVLAVDVNDGLGGFRSVADVRADGLFYPSYGLNAGEPLADVMEATQFAIDPGTGVAGLQIHAVAIQGSGATFNDGVLRYVAATADGLFAGPDSLTALESALAAAVEESACD